MSESFGVIDALDEDVFDHHHLAGQALPRAHQVKGRRSRRRGGEEKRGGERREGKGEGERRGREEERREEERGGEGWAEGGEEREREAGTGRTAPDDTPRRPSGPVWGRRRPWAQSATSTLG